VNPGLCHELLALSYPAPKIIPIFLI
jgi:hypothetical protein